MHGVKETITSIPKPRNNIPLDQIRVNNAHINLHVRMRRLHRPYPKLTPTHTNQLDLLASPLLQHVDRGDGGAAGAAHWVKDEADVVRVVLGELVVVFHGLQGHFVAEEAQVEDGGMREKVQEG